MQVISRIWQPISVMLLLTMAVSVQAREDIGEYPLEPAMNNADAEEKLNQDIRFYFAGQSHAKPTERISVVSTSKKTSSFAKSDSEACNWAFLSAMIALQENAVQRGANAIINIKSNYDNQLTESADSFVCGAGNLMAGVALQGELVKLP